MKSHARVELQLHAHERGPAWRIKTAMHTNSDNRIQPDADLAHWLRVLDTTHEELLAAIGKVGNDPAAVAAYLKRGSDSEPPGTTQLPDGG